MRPTLNSACVILCNFVTLQTVPLPPQMHRRQYSGDDALEKLLIDGAHDQMTLFSLLPQGGWAGAGASVGSAGGGGGCPGARAVGGAARRLPGSQPGQQGTAGDRPHRLQPPAGPGALQVSFLCSMPSPALHRLDPCSALSVQDNLAAPVIGAE